VPPISRLDGGLWLRNNQIRILYVDLFSRHNFAAPLIGLIVH